jgi:hypothetical protein
VPAWRLVNKRHSIGLAPVGASISRAMMQVALVRAPSPPTSRRHSILWSICELCGQQTEFAVALEAVGIYKRKANGVAMAVPLTNQMRAGAQQLADELVARYEKAISAIVRVLF